jgi:Carboxypeptidase regulatory-like domain
MVAATAAYAAPAQRVVVRGKVVLASTGEAIPDIEVVISEQRDATGTKHAGTTDAQGEFAIDITTEQKTLWCRVQQTGYDPSQLHLVVHDATADAATIKLKSPLVFGAPIVADGAPARSTGLVLTLPVQHNGKDPITFRELQIDGIIDKTPDGSCADPSTWVDFQLASSVPVENTHQPQGSVAVQVADANKTYLARAARLAAHYNGCSGGEFSIVMSGPQFTIPPRSQAKTDYQIEVRFPSSFHLIDQSSNTGGPQLVVKRCPAGSTCRVLHATLRTVGNSVFRTPDVAAQAYMTGVKQ